MPIHLGPHSAIHLGTSEPYSDIRQYPPTRLETAGRILYHGGRIAGKSLYYGAKATYYGAKIAYHTGRLTAKGAWYTGRAARAAHRWAYS
jgi:rare lipoprotein A (peptidoglycan hydrolase)